MHEAADLGASTRHLQNAGRLLEAAGDRFGAAYVALETAWISVDTADFDAVDGLADAAFLAMRDRPGEAVAWFDRWRGLFGDGVEARIEGSVVHLARCEALRALGRAAEASAALAEARLRLYRIAATLESPLRERYLAFAPNARLLALTVDASASSGAGCSRAEING